MSAAFRTDEDIIEAIKAGGPDRNAALNFVFSNQSFKKRISNFVSYHNGNQDDVHEVIVETLIIFDRNIRYNKFEKKSALSTYAYSIAKLYWISKIREDKRTLELMEKIEKDNVEIQNPELLYMKEETKLFFEKILKNLSDKCKEILKYWSLSYSYKEIAKELQIDNHNSIRKQKLYCQRKLAVFLKNNPQFIPEIYNEGNR